MPPDSITIDIKGNDNTQSVFQKLTANIVALEKENRKLENQYANISKRVTQYRGELRSLERRHETTRERISRLTGTIKELQTEVERVTKDYQNLEKRLDTQADTIRELQLANKELVRDLKRVQTQLEKNRTTTRNTDNATESLADRTLTASTIFNDFAGSLFQVSGLLQRIGAIGFEAVREFGRAALEIDRARESFISLGESVAVADNRIEELWELAQLPGVTFRGALQSAQLLEAVGVSAQDASQLIIEFGNAIELSGRTQVDFRETLRQVSQGISRNKVQQEELNVIFERAPIIARAVKEAYGTIDPEVITAQLKEAGESAEDFWRRIANETLPGQARANINSLQNQVTNLQNAFEQLKQGLGTALVPEIQTLTTVTRSLLDRFNDLSPGVQRTVAVATTGGTFLSQFGGALLEIAANVGLAIFGFRQMRGSLKNLGDQTKLNTTLTRFSKKELQDLTNTMEDMDKRVRAGTISQEDFSKEMLELAKSTKLTQGEFQNLFSLLVTGGLSGAAVVKTITEAGSAFTGLGSILLRALPYVGGVAAALGLLVLVLNKTSKETNQAAKETDEFEKSLERAETRVGRVSEFNKRIETLRKYRDALLQGRREDVPTGIGTVSEIRMQIDELTKLRDFYRDSDLPAFQKRFTEEIDANTTRLEEIFKRQDEILRELGRASAGEGVAGGVITRGLREIESPSLISYTRATRLALIREFRELRKESEDLESDITVLEKLFINLEKAAQEALKGTTDEFTGLIPAVQNFGLQLGAAQNALNQIRGAVSEATSEAGLRSAAENAKRLVDEIADLERQQALARENARAKDKRDAARLAAEIQQINLNAANTKVEIDKNAAAQSVNVYRTAFQAIRAEATSAITLRQLLATTDSAIASIDKITQAERTAARTRERLRDKSVQDAQKLADELLRIERRGAEDRLEIYEDVASQSTSVLTSVLRLVTNRQSLTQHESEIDRIKNIAIQAVRDIEQEELAQVTEREERLSIEEKNLKAFVEETVEIRRRAAERIRKIEQSVSDVSLEITRDELSQRIKLFKEMYRELETARQDFINRTRTQQAQFDVAEAEQRRDTAKKALDDILALETSSTDDRIKALDDYQKAAEEYNDEYLYQYQLTNKSAVDLTIQRTQREKELEEEVAKIREDINKRRLENERKLNQSINETREQARIREYERESNANQLELDLKEKARREEERIRRQTAREEERERNRLINLERRALSQRLQDYTSFYNALRTLDVSSVQNTLIGIARVTADYLANLATRAAADAAYAAQRAAIEQGTALSTATAQGAAAGLSALLGNPLAIAAVIGSIALSAISRRQATRQQPSAATVNTRTFHDASSDFLAEMAGREAARLTPQQTMMNRRQNARDFTKSFMDGFEDESRQRGFATGAGGGGDITIQLQLNDKVVQELNVRANTLQKQGRLPGGRRR